MDRYITVLTIILVAVAGVSAAVPQRPVPAAPLGGTLVEMPPIPSEQNWEMDGSYRDYGLDGACNRILETMCRAECGGMSIPWPAPPCEDPTQVHGNIFSPAGLGLLAAYPVTGAPLHLLASLDFSEFGICYTYDTGEYRIGSFTPYFLYRMTETIPTATRYRDHAEIEYFQALDNGTYGESSWNTRDFLAYVESTRIGSTINLRCYEMTTLLKASYLMGTPAQFDEFACWTMETAMDTLDSTQFYDVLGSAAGVFSLVSMQLDYDPQAGIWAAESDLQGVIDGLLNYQDPVTGGFVYSTQLTPPFADFDLDLQSSAYALLALKAFDPWAYEDEIMAAEDYIWNTQLANGGFLSYIGGSEVIQIDGEAIWALQYEPDPWNDGDVDGNDLITPQDSQMAFYIYLATLRPTWRQNSSADCNGDGRVTAGDAQCIFRNHLYGDCFCVDEIILPPVCAKNQMKNQPVHAMNGGQLVVDLHEDKEIATVTVSIDKSTRAVDSFSFDLNVPAHWNLLDTRFSDTGTRWIMAEAVQNDGFVRVGAFTTADQLTDSQQGELVELTFTYTNNNLLRAKHSTVRIHHLSDDIQDFNVDVIR